MLLPGRKGIDLLAFHPGQQGIQKPGLCKSFFIFPGIRVLLKKDIFIEITGKKKGFLGDQADDGA